MKIGCVYMTATIKLTLCFIIQLKYTNLRLSNKPEKLTKPTDTFDPTVTLNINSN